MYRIPRAWATDLTGPVLMNVERTVKWVYIDQVMLLSTDSCNKYL